MGNLLKAVESAQSMYMVLVSVTAAAVVYWLWARHLAHRSKVAVATLEDMAALGEIIPDTIHPTIDLDVCIGSGACVRACPESNVLEVVHGQAHLLNPLACIGHSACLPACPVEAIKLVFGTAQRGVELPKVDTHFQTECAGVYVVGELGGMGLIRNAVRQGKQAADHVVSASRRGRTDVYDAIVVGAGPAGISAMLRLIEGGCNAILLERASLGGTIMHYPRAKVAMTGTLEFAIVGKVARSKLSKEELIELWQSIVQKTQMPIRTGVLVEGVSREADGVWCLETSAGPFRGANVVLAVGRRGTPRPLAVPGEEQTKVHYRLLEPEAFKGQHVLVVGGGNSAVESAISLAESGGCTSVSISYRRAAFARCRAENRRRIDALIASGAVRALMPSEVVSIGADQVELKLNGGVVRIPNQAVIVQIGGTAPGELLQKFGITVVTKYGER